MTFHLKKIVDSDLREFAAAENIDERRSVSVELGLPPPTVPPSFLRNSPPRRADVGRHGVSTMDAQHPPTLPPTSNAPAPATPPERLPHNKTGPATALPSASLVNSARLPPSR